MARHLSGVLSISKQPCEVFYKDEGGKSNCLLVGVKLTKLKDGGKTCRGLERDLSALPLKLSIYYERGIRVEEHDQGILTVMPVGSAPSQPSVSVAKRATTLGYRIEKVSRRKDGQRFKVLIEADQARCPAHIDVSGIAACFTDAVLCLSKRKSGKRETAASIRSKRSAESLSSSGPGSGPEQAPHASAPSAKRRRRVTLKDLAAVEQAAAAQVAALEEKVERMAEMQQQQQTRLDMLERTLAARDSVDSLQRTVAARAAAGSACRCPAAAAAAAAATGSTAATTAATWSAAIPFAAVAAAGPTAAPALPSAAAAGGMPTLTIGECDEMSPVGPQGQVADCATLPDAMLPAAAAGAAATVKLLMIRPSMRRLVSADMTFNFGTPCSPMPADGPLPTPLALAHSAACDPAAVPQGTFVYASAAACLPHSLPA